MTDYFNTSPTMTATKSSTTPRHPWPRSHKTSTTPHGMPKAHTPASVGQMHPPRLTPGMKSPTKNADPRSPSPNYFGLIVDGGGGGNNPVDSSTGHVKKNWKSPSSSIQSKATPQSPAVVPHESNPEYEEFRKQSEAYAFNLSQRNFSGLSQYANATPSSPLAREPLKNSSARPRISDEDETISPGQIAPERNLDAMELDGRESRNNNERPPEEQQSFFDMPRNETPESVSNPRLDKLSDIDERHPRLSLPQNRVAHAPPHNAPKRAETLPPNLSSEVPTMIEPKNLERLLDGSNADNVLLLDLRVSPQFAQSRITGALNLCIPTTLLKRPSFNLQRLMDTFTDSKERERFGRWKDIEYIVVYDASSPTLKDAIACVNTLKKFTTEGWQGKACIVKGGFKEIAKTFPQLVVKPNSNSSSDTAHKLSVKPGNDIMPVAGGCPMPATKSAANPFFGNIRQNMDLIGGVGQFPVKLPDTLGQRGYRALPSWLQKAAEDTDEGKQVSDKFLHIEKEEQARMQKALSGHVSYGTPGPEVAKSIQVAGIEKGSKNRYKDMLPYDHSRVKLRDAENSGCDYINASHINAEWSNKRYIAAQAPIPATFEDFWRMIWEQEVRVIVNLSAETEGAQRKCHPYWVSGDYGSMKVKSLSEKRISLHSPNTLASNLKKASQLDSPVKNTGTSSRRRATNPYGGAAAADAARDSSANASDSPSEPSYILVRTLTVSHSSFPFQPMREIVQIQYNQWPDFGTPAHAIDLVGIVEYTNTFARQYRDAKTNPQLPVGKSEPPIVVHCSAGCGRTGTFCTIDSVVDMLKRQKIKDLSGAGKPDNMDVDSIDMQSGNGVGQESWELRDDIDLIEKAVQDFRLQRLSMVQTLKQFVLCYESVLEWLVKETPEKFRKEGMRRSFHG